MTDEETLDERMRNLAEPGSVAERIKDAKRPGLVQRMAGEFARAGRKLSNISDAEILLRLDYLDRSFPGQIFSPESESPKRSAAALARIAKLSGANKLDVANNSWKAKL